MNAGDTAFVLISAALVMLMTPGLALFYGGMVRNKNVLGTIMQSFIILGIITFEWVLWGYSMSFGPDHGSIIGALGGVICYGGVLLKSRLGYDDSLDVVGIHGLGGTWGALATGLFASTKINPDGANGLFFGNPGQLWIQFVSVVATMVFAFIMTLIILKIIDVLIGLRVSEEDEIRGLDISLHNEAGYSL